MNAALAYSAGFMDKIDAEKAQLLRDAREDFKSQAQAFEKDQLWAARSWNRVWKKQGLPAKGYAILEEKLDQRIRDFEDVAHRIFTHGAGEPDDFKSDEKIAEIRTAVSNIFKAGADTATLETALEVVNAKWREFSSAFVSSNMVASGSAEYSFEEEYQAAMDALKSYKQEDSVKGLITFALNRISWAGAAEEHKITEHLKLYGEDALNYWFNQYQVEAGKAGALRGGYLSNEVDDDFHRLA